MFRKFQSQGEAEDVLLRHRYLYFVLGCPAISDARFDALERHIRAQWSVGIACTVGSSIAQDYPEYVREGRRPGAVERMRRDWGVCDRWMEAL